MARGLARVAWTIAMKVGVAVTALGTRAAPAFAAVADGWSLTGSTVYRLDPVHGRSARSCWCAGAGDDG